MITQDELKQLLHYCPDTGIFTRVKTWGRYTAGSVAGSKDVHGYMQFRIGNKNHKMHRLAWLYMYGSFPDGAIDHINFDRSDNRITNLRLLSKKQHVEHRRANRNNTSGFRGVHLCKFTGRWIAQIKTNYQLVWLGRYPTPEAAHNAYVAAAKQIHSCNPEAGHA